jgi:hypothetical protein
MNGKKVRAVAFGSTLDHSVERLIVGERIDSADSPAATRHALALYPYLPLNDDHRP